MREEEKIPFEEDAASLPEKRDYEEELLLIASGNHSLKELKEIL